jgi:hypothetical protein
MRILAAELELHLHPKIHGDFGLTQHVWIVRDLFRMEMCA